MEEAMRMEDARRACRVGRCQDINDRPRYNFCSGDFWKSFQPTMPPPWASPRHGEVRWNVKPVGEAGNYRNGYRRRKLTVLGLGDVEVRVPRRSKWGVAFGKAAGSQETRSGGGSVFSGSILAGLSTQDLARLSEKYLGHKYDSKQVSGSWNGRRRIWKRGGVGGWSARTTNSSMSMARIFGCPSMGESAGKVSLRCLELVKKTNASKCSHWKWGIGKGRSVAKHFYSLVERGLHTEAVELGIIDRL